jgi:putative aminopeptidase FrvX
MNPDQMLALLSELIACHAPFGDEHEIDVVIRREFEAASAHVWQDSATNLYAHLPGDGPRAMVCAHKDEIGMIVAEVLPNGRLCVQNLGGSAPWKYGEGPVDVLADDGQTVRAVLSVGSVHTRTGPVAELAQSRALTWDLVTLYTGLTPGELAARTKARIAIDTVNAWNARDWENAGFQLHRLGVNKTTITNRIS